MAASTLTGRTAALLSVSSFKSVIPVISGLHAVQQRAAYNPRALKLNLTEIYVPDKNSEKTPEWQKTEKFERKLFARYGSASGVEPARLWPNPARLQEMIREEREWHPPLEEMLNNIAERDKELNDKRVAR